jgi:hypothetical protein
VTESAINCGWPDSRNCNVRDLRFSQSQARNVLGRCYDRVVVDIETAEAVDTLRTEIRRVESSLTSEIIRVRTSLAGEIARVETSLGDTIDRLERKVDQVETSLSVKMDDHKRSADIQFEDVRGDIRMLAGHLASISEKVDSLRR